MRVTRAAIIVGIALALITSAALPTSAEMIGEKTFTLIADTVLVNKGGGITVSGTLDCTAAVEEAYEGSTIPSEFAVFTNVNWRATQYVGRGKVVTAVWESAVASVCYGSPFEGSGTWQTRYPYPSGAIQWVYSATGKFQAGTIHIEVWSEGEIPVGEDSYLLATWGGYDLKAIKSK